ncbi:hypothetical protein O59_003797 [Cellvibrio sp. BR]|nr:hypothetical protein O59_003797 [Cellvibrio sp. BR]
MKGAYYSCLRAKKIADRPILLAILAIDCGNAPPLSSEIGA